MNQLHRRTYAQVDLKKLAHNFKTLRALVPPGTFVCPMVKANAYGHGDIEIARRLELEGAEQLGVALVEEGISLRQAGIRVPIFVFSLFETFSVPSMIEHKLTPIVSNWSQLEALAKAAKPSLEVHIKFNTGMSRLGFAVEEAPKLRRYFDSSTTLKLRGIATHLLHGSDAGIPGGHSEAQLIRLEEAAKAFQGMSLIVHALNSAGCVNMHARRAAGQKMSGGMQWPLGARFGISLYGGHPGSLDKSDIDLKPVMSFRSHVAHVHTLKVGEKVSYNAIWKAERPSVIGVVPLGYADGFPRVYSNNAEVLCKGRRVPVTGTVCMDYFMIDLTDVATVGENLVGEEVVLFGEQGREEITAEELAKRGSTISYEVFTRISARVPRQYVE